MNLGDVEDHSINAFGDAYEHLMTMYAFEESGFDLDLCGFPEGEKIILSLEKMAC